MPETFDEIITRQGSSYKRLPDGTTQRFKTATDELLEPQQAIVFIPTYDELKAAVPDGVDFEGIFGANDLFFEQKILGYAQNKGLTIYIVNQNGERLYSNEEIGSSGRVFLVFGKKGEQSHFSIPVSKIPRIGYKTFDTRTYKNDSGEDMNERHIGSEIITIIT